VATEFLLPDIGEGLTEAEIVRWMVAVGDEIGLDEPLVEVETAKAVVEIPSPRAGVVLHLGGAEGDTLLVGTVLAVIGEPGEVWPAGISVAPVPDAAAPPAGDRPPGHDLPLVGTLTEDGIELPSRVTEPAATPAGPAKALPLVRKLARDAGIDLAVISGTGPDGRITRADVEALIGGAPPAAASVPTPARPGDGANAGERVRMSMLRRTIAEHMARSWAEIPHVTTFDEVDATRLLEVRNALATRHATPIPIEALVAKAVVPAVAAFPFFNATIDGDELILHAPVNLGIAVDTDDGLLVPVIESAQDATVLELASAVEDLGRRGRERTLTPGELRGATFTISNIGAVGGGYGTPLVPHGTTAILSIGRATDRAVVRAGVVAIAPMMPLSLSFDHRVIDGGMGRRFMATVLENLAEPALFLA